MAVMWAPSGPHCSVSSLPSCNGLHKEPSGTLRKVPNSFPPTFPYVTSELTCTPQAPEPGRAHPSVAGTQPSPLLAQLCLAQQAPRTQEKGGHRAAFLGSVDHQGGCPEHCRALSCWKPTPALHCALISCLKSQAPLPPLALSRSAQGHSSKSSLLVTDPSLI